MFDLTDIRSTPMPDEMHALLKDYPRDSWEANPHFASATKNWLAAHKMFRDLSYVLRTGTERYLDRDMDPEHYETRLSVFGDRLVRSLHGHHAFEDNSYFPELSAADPRFDAGLAILQKDHLALDTVLDRLTHVANRTIKLIQLDETAARDEAALVHNEAGLVEVFLARHLGDEEELAVPIILHHHLRG